MTGFDFGLALVAAAMAADGGVAPLAAVSHRTTTFEGTLALGTAVERVVPSPWYGLAVAKDAEQRWMEAAGFYQQAISEWSSATRAWPSAALETAIQKAERERQRSQLLAHVASVRGGEPAAAKRVVSLERARLLRTKLMVVRAFTGAAPYVLYRGARDGFRAAMRPEDPSKPGANAELYLMLCATHAAMGREETARLALAHVSGAQRGDPANALPMAICAAALGQSSRALTLLEAHVQRQGADLRADPIALRDILLANDWDRLRGDRRFESLFARVTRY